MCKSCSHKEKNSQKELLYSLYLWATNRKYMLESRVESKSSKSSLTSSSCVSVSYEHYFLLPVQPSSGRGWSTHFIRGFTGTSQQKKKLTESFRENAVLNKFWCLFWGNWYKTQDWQFCLAFLIYSRLSPRWFASPDVATRSSSFPHISTQPQFNYFDS